MKKSKVTSPPKDAVTSTKSVDERSRLAIAHEIIRRCDTVALLTFAECQGIIKRALTGEFDDFFEDE